jgi:hypothetical protein
MKPRSQETLLNEARRRPWGDSNARPFAPQANALIR